MSRNRTESIAEEATLGWLQGPCKTLPPKRVAEELRVNDAEAIAEATA